MTMAIKAGHAGKAFSYITDELKKLATRTIAYADELTEKGQSVIDLFTEFRKALKQLQQLHLKTFEGLESRLGGGMADIHGTFQKIADRLNGAVGKAREVSKPLFRIMEELQTQDLIKQSMDHVLLSLRQIDDQVGDGLDVAGATSLLAGLGKALLQDIRDRLAGSCGIFEDSYQILRQDLEDVESERRDFLRAMTTGSGDEESGWLERFEGAMRGIGAMLDEIDQCLSAKRIIREFGPKLEKGLLIVEESFGKFYGIIDQFYSIEVVSRIEVAKQKVLREREAILVEMSDLTGKIERDVATAVAEIRSSFTRTQQTLGRYDESVLDDEAQTSDILQSTRSNQQELNAAKDNLHSLASRFTFYTPRFFSLLHESENQTKQFREYTRHLDRVIETLAEVQRSAEGRKEELLRQAGMEDWQLSDDKVERLVEKFTILTHKKVAADMIGFEVEDGDDAGNLTLF